MNRIILKAAAAAMLLWLALPLLPKAAAQTSPSPSASPAPVNSVTPAVLPSDINPASPLGQVIRLLQSGVDESIILTYITNATAPFNLTTDDVIYLNDLGSPPEIVTAMIQHDQQMSIPVATAPPPPPPDQSLPPEQATEDYFYGALAPYGTWVNLPDYGLCWQPCANNYNSDWTPYCTQGQWVYSDCGWYWMSNYSWGWCTFHYGRWFQDAQRGWCWCPDTTWAPSWVFWRYSGDYSGWAPLPPHTYYQQGSGLMYNGAVVSTGFGFGLSAKLFTFVPSANFCDPHLDRHRLLLPQISEIFGHTKVLSNINSNERTIVNDGITPTKIAGITARPIPSYTIQAAATTTHGGRGEQVLADGRTLAIDRPYFNEDAPAALSQGIRPTPAQTQTSLHQIPPLVMYGNGNESPAPTYHNANVYYLQPGHPSGPPVPRVTTAGPQDHPAADTASRSYWTTPSETPVTANNQSALESPRLEEQQAHEVPPAGGSREFNHDEEPNRDYGATHEEVPREDAPREESHPVEQRQDNPPPEESHSAPPPPPSAPPTQSSQSSSASQGRGH
jgi:hypothetical protein